MYIIIIQSCIHDCTYSHFEIVETVSIDSYQYSHQLKRKLSHCNDILFHLLYLLFLCLRLGEREEGERGGKRKVRGRGRGREREGGRDGERERGKRKRGEDRRRKGWREEEKAAIKPNPLPQTHLLTWFSPNPVAAM